MTALFLAAQAGNLAVVKQLAQAGADLTIVRRDGSSCLFVSAKNGHHEVVEYLLIPGVMKTADRFRCDFPFQNDAFFIKHDNFVFEMMLVNYK